MNFLNRIEKLEKIVRPQKITLQVEKHPECTPYYEDIYFGGKFDRRLIGISLDDL